MVVENLFKKVCAMNLQNFLRCAANRYTVELGYIGSMRTAKFIQYIGNPISTRKLLLFLLLGPKTLSNISDYTI